MTFELVQIMKFEMDKEIYRVVEYVEHEREGKWETLTLQQYDDKWVLIDQNKMKEIEKWLWKNVYGKLG